MTAKADPWARGAAIALTVEPVVFIVAVVVEEILRPGFNVLTNTISDLGVDSNGWSYSWTWNASRNGWEYNGEFAGVRGLRGTMSSTESERMPRSKRPGQTEQFVNFWG